MGVLRNSLLPQSTLVFPVKGMAVHVQIPGQLAPATWRSMCEQVQYNQRRSCYYISEHNYGPHATGLFSYQYGRILLPALPIGDMQHFLTSMSYLCNQVSTVYCSCTFFNNKVLQFDKNCCVVLCCIALSCAALCRLHITYRSWCITAFYMSVPVHRNASGKGVLAHLCRATSMWVFRARAASRPCLHTCRLLGGLDYPHWAEA